MPKTYQDIYPEEPLQKSADLECPSASDLLTLEFFQADPGEMPYEVFSQHHILLNLLEEPHRVENWRDGEHRDFIFHKNEIVVTPAGIRSGWKWHVKSKVIVITLEPEKLEHFAHSKLGIMLKPEQLKSIPQFIDEDITHAGIMLLDALNSQLGSAVMFEGLARVFLTKLIQKYGLEEEEIAFSKSFTSQHYKRVLDYVSKNFAQEITLETMAQQAGLSPYHFARLFKKTIGQTPHQYVMSYRIEQAKQYLANPETPMIDIALSCGFADQAHFSRTFKKLTGTSPKTWRQQQ